MKLTPDDGFELFLFIVFVILFNVAMLKLAIP